MTSQCYFCLKRCSTDDHILLCGCKTKKVCCLDCNHLYFKVFDATLKEAQSQCPLSKTWEDPLESFCENCRDCYDRVSRGIQLELKHSSDILQPEIDAVGGMEKYIQKRAGGPCECFCFDRGQACECYKTAQEDALRALMMREKKKHIDFPFREIYDSAIDYCITVCADCVPDDLRETMKREKINPTTVLSYSQYEIRRDEVKQP